MNPDTPVHLALISLGSNLGDRAALIDQALHRLEATPQVHVTAVSSLHETDPVGGPAGQGRFLNGAARLETALDADDLLDRMLGIEHELGRERRERWGARTIDLDLLVYDDLVIATPGLILPHPRMHERRFVLEPLAEIAPEVVHPVLGRTVRELLAGK